jgi:ethanolamine phosphate phosphodiesterase
LNQVIDMNGRLVVFINSPGLVDEDYRRMAARKDFDAWKGSDDSVVEFVKRVALGKPR